MSDEIIKNLGPLASLAGIWEGDKCIDVSRIHSTETETKFHEELGYWLWDKDRKQVLRCFMVPRGVLVNAGGDAESDSKQFHLSAEVGSETYGILSNKFLDETYKTKKYIIFPGLT